jgi:carbon monoxide dehydrogenase subunit G
MKVDGSFKLNTPVQKAWDILLKGDTLASCVPGAEKIETTDGKLYHCLMKQSVGPISVKLQFDVELTEVKAPSYVKAKGKGSALGNLGTFTMDMTVNLKELSPNECEVFYDTDANIVGKLATFGERIMRAKATSTVEQFTKNLQKKLETGTK